MPGTRPNTQRAALLAALVAGLACSTPAAAQPTWLPPFDVAPSDRATNSPSAVFTPSGELAIAWASSAGGDSGLPQARRPAGGAVAPAPALAAGNGADTPVLAVGPDGTVYAAWASIDPSRFGDGAITVARLNPDGSIAQSAVVSGEDNASTPDLAVAPNGTLGVAWVDADDADLGTVRAAVGGFGAFVVRTISTADNNAADPAVAFDLAGALRVAWSRLDSGGAGRIKLAAMTAAGAVSGATLVTGSEANAGEPDIAIDPAFGVAAAWTEIDGAENGTVKLAQALPSGAFPAIAQVAPGGGDGSSPQLAVTSGHLRLAWVRTDPQERGSALVTDADGGVPSPTPAVVSGGDDASSLRLTYAPSGDGAAVWRRGLDPSDENAGDVRAAGFDASGPQLLDVAIPAEATVGTAASFSVRPVDLWSAVSAVTWAFGDGATGAGAGVSHTYTAPASPARVTVQATDAVGNSSSAEATTTVRAAAAPPPTPPPPPPGPQPPNPAAVPALALQSPAADFTCIRYLGARAPLSKATFTFALSEPATVTIRLQRRLSSRPLRRCPRIRVKGAAGRYEDAVTVTVPAAGGAGALAVGPDGEKLGAGAARVRRPRTMWRRGAAKGRTRIKLAAVTGTGVLAPGTYIALMSAVTADGRTASASPIKFWILDRRR